MSQGPHRFHRILSIDVTSRGFGYVVLETPEILIDWGVCQVRTEKRERSLVKVAALIHRFVPHVVVVEDTRHEKCRRGDHARGVIEVIANLAQTMDVPVDRVSTATVRGHYADLGETNKDDVARLIVDSFPELAPFLPKRRKVWMPEDERMAIFDAISMTLVLDLSARPAVAS